MGHCLALTAAALVLFAVLWLAMLMKVSTAGIVHETTLTSGPLELVRHGLWPLALAVAFTTAIAPLGKFAGMLYVLVGAARCNGCRPTCAASSWFARKMGIWAMLEVLLLGVFVAYTKLGDLVHIELGPAVYALGLLTIVTVWADTALDPDAVWEEIERRGQTHAPMPRGRARSPSGPARWAARAAAWSAVPAEHDGTVPALRLGAACAQARQPQPHLGARDRRRRSSTSRPTSIRCSP